MVFVSTTDCVFSASNRPCNRIVSTFAASFTSSSSASLAAASAGVLCACPPCSLRLCMSLCNSSSSVCRRSTSLLRSSNSPRSHETSPVIAPVSSLPASNISIALSVSFCATSILMRNSRARPSASRARKLAASTSRALAIACSACLSLCCPSCSARSSWSSESWF